MKNLIFIGMLLCAALAYAVPVYAATANSTGFVPLAGIPNLTTGVTADQTGLQNFLRNLYIYLIGIAAIIAVFQIARGGVLIAMGKDSISKQLSGKGLITQSLLGLVLILSPAIVFSVINPEILNLSVNIPPLDTSWTAWAPPAAATTQQINQNSNNIGAQVSSAEQDCLNKGAGWSPTLNYGALATPNSVTCVPPLPAAGAAITGDQCMHEPGYQAGYSLQQIPSATCGTSGVKILMQQGGYVCSPLSSGGVCLHK